MQWTEGDVPDQRGRVAVVTGGNSGIGFQAAQVLATRGADVILACRDAGKAATAATAIVKASPGAKAQAWSLDLASLASVRAFAARFAQERGALHMLINNAGVMAIPRALTEDGFEMQLGVNHLGHFALTGLLLPSLLATPDARVVNVSSNASRMGSMRWDDLDRARGYEKWTAYGQSKLANLLFTFELARRVKEKSARMHSLACHPGYAATNLQYVGPALEGSRVVSGIMWLGNTLLAQSAQAGAWPTLFAATHASAKNGDYIGPSGLREWRGAPTHVQPRRLAQNADAMRKLWDVSVQRTGVDFAALG